MSGGFEHLALMASAGSGKTFRLAHRYIALLLSGVEPSRICALTFSRKAAGEIFDNIVKYLYQASMDEKQCALTAGQIGRPEMAAGDFRAALRKFLSVIPWLSIGTLDSFTVGVLKAFPLETGLPVDFELMDNESSEAAEMRRMILHRIFNSRYVKPEDRDRFLESVKMASFGKQEKRVDGVVNEQIRTFRKLYLALPDSRAWGNEDRIWPVKPAWLHDGKADLDEEAEALRKALVEHARPDEINVPLLAFASFCSQYSADAQWDSSLIGKKAVQCLLEQFDSLADGKGTIVFRKKKHDLTREEACTFYRLISRVLTVELEKNLHISRGVFRILDQYERHYEELLRSSGMLTFEDAQYMLSSSNEGAGSHVVSRLKGGEGRLFIDYRLDSRLDHWLLDEFQDTSDLQWSVLSNLIDEIIQDQEGERSFFYVGDVKQAIYGWRGGNVHLFGHLLESYPTVKLESMNESYRSGPSVIGVVNEVFSTLPKDGLPAKAVDQWSRIWQEHSCADKGQVMPEGCCQLLKAHPGAGRKKPKQDDFYALAAALLREIQPINRGLTCGLLVRDNDKAEEVYHALRQQCPDIPVILQGRSGLRDNPAVELMLSLIKFSDHPGDLMARRHIQMSAAGQYLRRTCPVMEQWACFLLREIHANGYAGFCRKWMNRLGDLSKFERFRLCQLTDAASVIDKQRAPNAGAFIRYIDGLSLPEAPAGSAVRIMTIHQSKGLEFDVVIMPGLPDRGMAVADMKGITISCGETGHWALQMPRRDLAARDSTLQHTIEVAEQEQCFENLCALYVAMTRAKHALYMITGETGSSHDANWLVQHQLGSRGEEMAFGSASADLLYARGDHAWYRERDTVKEAEPEKRAVEVNGSVLQWQGGSVVPSHKATDSIDGYKLFDRTGFKARRTGTAVHKVLESLEWINRDWSFASWWAGLDGVDVWSDEVKSMLENALTKEEVRSVFERPEGECTLWMEQSFELILSDQWVSGVIDRAVIQYRDSRPVTARIYDFKTDEVESGGIEDAVSLHRRQMEFYRVAVSEIVGIETAAITAELVFLNGGKVVSVGA